MSDRRAWRALRAGGAAAVVLLGAACANHYLIHPRRVPEGVVTRAEVVVRGDLQLRLQWAHPLGQGPFPAVLVHPEAGHRAKEMRGIARHLAEEGYLALAVDYRRRSGPGRRFRQTLFPWREEGDEQLALQALLAHPLADADRVGALGYSQGGIFSLIVAAARPEVDAVVAYYPLTDLHGWLHAERHGMGRLVFRMIRWHFRRQSGARTDAEFEEVLRRGSPLERAEEIRAPVLLVHGTKDRSADVEESRRLAARLRELGREVELFEVAGAGHVFNFKRARRARAAWEPTLAWLDRHVKGTAAPSLDPARDGRSAP